VTLIKGSSLILAGHAIFALAQWAIILILARLGDAETVGMYSYGLALTAPIVLFANMGIRQALATDARGDFPPEAYMRVRLVTTIVAVSALVAFAVLVERPAIAATVAAIAFAKAFEALSDVQQGLFQRHERMDLVARSLSLRAITGSLSLGTAFVLTHNVAIAAAAMGLAWLVVWRLHDVTAAHKLRLSEEKVSLRMCWRLGMLVLPLGAVSMLISLTTNLPRLIIEGELGAAALGRFAAVVYLTIPATMAMNAVGQAVAPRLSRLIAAGEIRSFWRLLWSIAGLGVAGAILLISGAWLFGPRVMVLLYGADFDLEMGVLLWVIVGAALSFATTAFGHAMTAARLFWPQLPLFALTAAASFGSAIVLVPAYGLVGAAWVMVLCSCVQLTGSFIVLRRGVTAKPQTPRPERQSFRAALRPDDGPLPTTLQHDS